MYLTLLKWAKRAWVWVKHYWYIPVILILSLFLLIVTRDKKSVSKALGQINDIRDKERKAVKKIEQEFQEKQKFSEEKAEKEKEKVREDASDKLADAERRIEEDLKPIEHDSEAINDELEDLLND